MLYIIRESFPFGTRPSYGMDILYSHSCYLSSPAEHHHFSPLRQFICNSCLISSNYYQFCSLLFGSRYTLGFVLWRDLASPFQLPFLTQLPLLIIILNSTIVPLRRVGSVYSYLHSDYLVVLLEYILLHLKIIIHTNLPLPRSLPRPRCRWERNPE